MFTYKSVLTFVLGAQIYRLEKQTIWFFKSHPMTPKNVQWNIQIILYQKRLRYPSVMKGFNSFSDKTQLLRDWKVYAHKIVPDQLLLKEHSD